MTSPPRFSDSSWAVILGGSSGIGLATAKRLCEDGMSVCVVHRDRRGAMDRIAPAFEQMRSNGHGFVAFNVDALDPAAIETVVRQLRSTMGPNGRVHTLVHCIAFGNLKPLVVAPPTAGMPKAQAIRELANKLCLPPDSLQQAIDDLLADGVVGLHGLARSSYGEMVIEEEDMARTIHAMGTSLLTWVQQLFAAQLFAADARVFGLTSEGRDVCWVGYAAVAAAKAALESICRAIAVEFGPHGIRCNLLQPGITDTPALRPIPGNLQMKASAQLRNPLGRLTRPDDVAAVISLLSTTDAGWINGSLIHVDGGEHHAAS